MPPTPLSPDFDPLGFPEGRPAPSGFGGSLRPCHPKTAPGFAVCSTPWDPKAPRNFAFAPFGSSCDVLPFAPIQSNHPKALRPSRLLHPACPKAALMSLRSAGLIRRCYSLDPPDIPVRSSGPGAIIRRVSATRPPAAYEDPMPKHLTFVSLPRCLAHVPGCPASSAALRCNHERSARKLSIHVGTSVKPPPIVSLARSNRAQRGLMSQPRNCVRHLADPIALSKIKPLSFRPISRPTAFGLDVMNLSSNPIRAKREIPMPACG